MAEAWRLDARERVQLAEHGFVVRREVFRSGEIGAIGDGCDALVERLLEEKRNAKVAVGSYTFEIQQRLATIVKWEQENPDLLLGVEPFALRRACPRTGEDLSRTRVRAWRYQRYSRDEVASRSDPNVHVSSRTRTSCPARRHRNRATL